PRRPAALATKTAIEGGSLVGSQATAQADGPVVGPGLVREREEAEDDDDGGRDPAGEREFFGTVEAMNGSVWTVSGQQVTIGSGTEIKGNITNGSQGKVHATLQADGTLLAREIELARDDDDDDDRNRAGEQEFFGTVEAMNGNVWTGSGRQITI